MYVCESCTAIGVVIVCLDEPSIFILITQQCSPYPHTAVPVSFSIPNKTRPHLSQQPCRTNSLCQSCVLRPYRDLLGFLSCCYLPSIKVHHCRLLTPPTPSSPEKNLPLPCDLRRRHRRILSRLPPPGSSWVAVPRQIRSRARRNCLSSASGCPLPRRAPFCPRDRPLFVQKSRQQVGPARTRVKSSRKSSVLFRKKLSIDRSTFVCADLAYVQYTEETQILIDAVRRRSFFSPAKCTKFGVGAGV